MIFIINNYSNYYFGTIEPLNGSVVTKNLTFFSLKVSLDGTIEPYKRSNRKVESSMYLLSYFVIISFILTDFDYNL
jgi:hypothetical protein